MSAQENLQYFEQHSIDELPHVIECRAAEEGAHVAIVGATHGNEPAGVEAIIEIHRCIANGQFVLKAGAVSLLLGNPAAYARNVRYLERDLNRSFTAPDEATVEGRRAREIRAFFRRRPHIAFVLDLHSVSIGDFKIVVYNAEEPHSEMLARTLSPVDLHLAYHPEHLPGALIDAAASGGLILECGNHNSKTGGQTAIEHINRALAHFGIIAPDGATGFEAAARVIRYETIQPIVPHQNFAFTIPEVATGNFLEAGRRYAVDDRGEHRAPQDCYVVVPSRHVRPTDSDAGFLCSRDILTI